MFSAAAFLGVCLSLATPVSASDVKGLSPQKQQQQFEYGLDAAKRGALDKAYKIWMDLKRNPTNSLELQRALQNNLAVILMQQRKYDEAERILDQSLQSDKQIATTLDNLNQIYAYQAQKAYKSVFSKSKLVEPKGEWLSYAAPQGSDIATQIAQTKPVAKPIVKPDSKEPEANKELVIAIAGDQKRSESEPEISKPKFNLADSINALEMTGLVESWRQAWASQDVDRYLSFYDSEEFVPKSGMSYSEWERSRQRILKRPKFIRIYLDDIHVEEISSDERKVMFTQRYQSDRFKDSMHKTLVWKAKQGDWKIIKEQASDEE
ncbi:MULTISPECIES: tetratricopeptide repeat protein [Thiomicrorhabdus]|uniref:Tetratricopeptide repeat protein n=1 Tax=Thiomicrorhabdus heinhorstiae TaxID=2748010 RepID=A0ABS0BYV6_9GAMM|nr:MULTISPECIES: tetratricopeptide repeat protein [Thiomicrorhabdus]MBF6057257.1 tetratricopeptide repeat protein [Thiomicrorhabdus heinhorstiae]